MTKVLGILSHILLGTLLLAIAGCAIQPAPPEPLQQEQINILSLHQQQLNGLHNWQLKGRLAINFNGESWNATIHWQKRPERYDIQLYLPLGQGSLHLAGDSRGATLKTSEGEHFMADSGENLFYQQFGLIFPVTALHDWIIGRPATGEEASSDWLQQVDESGQMVSLEQDNWTLRLMSYQNVSGQSSNASPDVANTISLPRKIFLRQNGNSVRLVVQQWQLDD
jgi:outer membrane lipoprotein LolB